MKLTILLAFLFGLSSSFLAQIQSKPSNAEIETLPSWAQKMYGVQPNVFEVDSLYKNYYRQNLYVKSYHTQYYKRWRRSVANKILPNGQIQTFSAQELNDIQQNYMSKQSLEKSSNWSVVGPIHNTEGNGTMGSGQTNVYSLDQCLGSLNVLYLGTEPGEVYKSVDGGASWLNSSMTTNFGSGVSAIEVHPSNPNIVFAGGNSGVFRSLDGGANWINVLPNSNFNVNEILINEGNTQIVLAATDLGLFRSINGGTNWTQLYTEKSYDVKMNTGNPAIVYLLKSNPALIICEFYTSTDFGATWTIQSNGWYSSTDPARNDGGGRIGVTEADPNRIYAYLIGEAKANDYGYIGVFKSTNGGANWSLPSTPTGGPYTATHINLAYGEPNWTYHQGFYNCGIAVSNVNADEILVGGLNLFKSTDGGATFVPRAGYVGGPLGMHVDMQDFRVINNETWVTTDGGVYHSNDFFTNDYSFMMDGVHGSDFWGFGSGWNEDVLVGGLYHNGNIAYHQNYGSGTFLELGGGEAPTGYVNPGNNRKTYFSDIGGKYLPLNLNDPILNFSNGMSPNEAYWEAESSEMEFHPNCSSIAYLGKDNKLWKTMDGGGSYDLVKEFGSNADNLIHYIEISSSNPNVMYVTQRPQSGSLGFIWKTIDGGTTWNSLTLPAGNSRRILLSINPSNENELWIAYPSGSNGNKVFKTTNGGGSWTNLTTTLLNNENIVSIAHIAGTDGGLYAGTNKAIFYRNNATPWVIDNAGLPTFMPTNIMRPFYRDGKIRVASYGKGIWESSMNEQPAEPICRIMVDKLEQTVFCDLDSFFFEDHSFLNHDNATWQWQFPTGTPSTSSQRNPTVLFSTPGNHLAVLTITDAIGNVDQDSLTVIVTSFVPPQFVSEGFQNGFLPAGWYQTNYDGNGQWALSTDAGGFGTSSQSAIFANFNIDSQGTPDDLNVLFNTQNTSIANLSFDVAFSEYGGQYSDTLEVLISADCGETFTSVFLKGGATLSTAPNSSEFFTPTASQWRTEDIDISSFSGNDKLVIAFRNIGHWGNNIYIDNINISTNLGVKPIAKSFDVYPNPICAGEQLHFGELEPGATIKIVDPSGKLKMRTKLASNELTIPANFKTGVYWINIETSTEILNKKIVVLER